MERSLLPLLKKEHPIEKMLFLAGPRQTGKTTLSKTYLSQYKNGGHYFNWDNSADRRKILDTKRMDEILKDTLKPSVQPMLIFDELHKMRQFKNWLKGFYDTYKDDLAIWVTGSGKLDIYQSGGDSLMGRYFLYHVHPFSIGEIYSNYKELMNPEDVWKSFIENEDSRIIDYSSLFQYGGFPEPFLKQSKTFHQRWISLRRTRISHEEVRELTRIEDLDRIEYLIELLNPRVGMPLSINSLREDLFVAFETVRDWLAVLKRLYYVFSLRPYSERLQRTLKREQKFYYWDWSEVENLDARFENFIISHLFKACQSWNDFGLGDFKLWYLRDKDKNEVDALITKSKKPWLMVEVKRNETTLSPKLISFSKLLKCERVIQIIDKPNVFKCIKDDNRFIYLSSAGQFLKYLP